MWKLFLYNSIKKWESHFEAYFVCNSIKIPNSKLFTGITRTTIPTIFQVVSMIINVSKNTLKAPAKITYLIIFEEEQTTVSVEPTLNF